MVHMPYNCHGYHQEIALNDKAAYILFYPTTEHELVESEDHVEVNGVVFNKPFVEKPVSAEDHNIYIYYPTSAGGGSQRLFRKVSRVFGFILILCSEEIM